MKKINCLNINFYVIMKNNYMISLFLIIICYIFTKNFNR